MADPREWLAERGLVAAAGATAALAVAVPALIVWQGLDVPDPGVWRALGGTLVVSTLAALVAAPLGVGTAVWTWGYAGPRARLVRRGLVALQAVPSIAWAMGAASVTAVIGAPIAVAVAAVGVMSAPSVALAALRALQTVPPGVVDAALALGATRAQTVRDVGWPAARVGLARATAIGGLRAIADTMVVLIVLPPTWSTLTTSVVTSGPALRATAAVVLLALSGTLGVALARRPRGARG